MNTLKRFLALALSLVLMVVCFAGCHEKNEVAVTINGMEFTSAYYACALVFADTEARNLVNEQVSTDGTVSADIVYWNYKVENTDYVKWVKDTAINTIKETAFIKSTCQKNNIELSKEDSELAELQAETQWESIGTYMEQNGVGKETFKKYVSDLFLTDVYFEHIYGEGGEKAIAKDAVSKQLSDHYVLVNGLTSDFSSMTDTQKKEAREKFTAYEKALNDGSKTFEQVYLEESGQKPEDHKHEEPAEGEAAPKDYHASLMSDTNTSFSSDQFETAKKMKVGEVKLITLEEDAGLLLLVKKDIMDDPYYLEEFDMTLRQELKEDEFLKSIETGAKALTPNINDFAVDQFDVKELVYS